MNFLNLAKSRFSARAYLDTPIENEKLALILDAGRVAPTGNNAQPQRILAVTSAEGLKKLDKAAKRFGAPTALIVSADHRKTFKNPFSGKDIADIDASIVTDHMMLMAKSLDIDSVWVCCFNRDVLIREFDIPDGIEPINILMLGYADYSKLEPDSVSPDRHEKRRFPISQTVEYK